MKTFLVIVTVLNTYYYHNIQVPSVTPMPDWHTCAQVRDAVLANSIGSNSRTHATCIATK